MLQLDSQKLTPIVSQALAEDRGAGDVTSRLTVDPFLQARGDFRAKEDLVLAGWPVVAETFRLLSDRFASQAFFGEGDRVAMGSLLGTVRGPALLLLGGERVALNFLQRCSGIATLTRAMVGAVEGSGISVLDTRKTTPGLRFLEKYAVAMGGGKNHRFGLYDGILIKENHIRAAGGIEAAVSRIRSGSGTPQRIEVEVSNLQELEQALRVGVEAILLDNMTPGQVRECVDRARGQALLEVSGGIDLHNIRDYAVTGVDFISVGALTHSAKAADISLELQLASPCGR
ncbi:MAG: carboxylating nicotinate-nucleotide diphosphorylase [Acidobacteriota bacterium]|nr:carboxylating nicotinate-nucleotide diphosphorylase [Acidobacteriota bacterium]